MAVLIIQPEDKDAELAIVERIEVRPWWMGGTKDQEFSIGSGGNFGANSNILIEIMYEINEAQFFYTRNFFHNGDNETSLLKRFEIFKTGESDVFGFGDILPETSVSLKRTKGTYQSMGEERSYTSYSLIIAADIGAGIAMDSPGLRSINIELDVEEQEGLEFMHQLVCEIGDLYQGKHPDPAALPAASSQWHFARSVNQKGYDQVAAIYEEHYFSAPLLTEAFDAWLQSIPSGGHILDVGCGHGKPIIARLLERGYRVTGADLSPKMLERARQNFPDVPFVNRLASELTFESEFDGACSLSSLLYLDPIDLAHSLYRLHRALKPNGVLFLYASDLHPGFRGDPYHKDLEQWMWGWTYGMDEAARALEDHGYFRVLSVQDVTSEQAKQEKIEKWYQWARENYETQRKQYPNVAFQEPDREKPPKLSYQYVVVAQARNK